MKYSRTRAGDVDELWLIKTSLSAKAGELTGVFDGTSGVFDGTSELTKNYLNFIMHSLRCFATNSMKDVETLISSDFPAIEASKHSIARPKTSNISKNFVAYIEALVCTVPYFKPTDAAHATQ